MVESVCMFHCLNPLKNVQIFKGNVNFFTIKEWVIDPCLMYNKIIFLVNHFWACFDHSSLNQMYFLTQISIRAFFLLFHLNFIYTKNLGCPSRIICYLFIRLCMYMIIFLMKIVLSFLSHQTRILSAGLGMAWNR